MPRVGKPASGPAMIIGSIPPRHRPTALSDGLHWRAALGRRPISVRLRRGVIRRGVIGAFVFVFDRRRGDVLEFGLSLPNEGLQLG